MKTIARGMVTVALSCCAIAAALAATQQIAARGRTESEACTNAHNEVVRWSQQYGLETQCHRKANVGGGVPVHG